jgi:hypothetical protein
VTKPEMIHQVKTAGNQCEVATISWSRGPPDLFDVEPTTLSNHMCSPRQTAYRGTHERTSPHHLLDTKSGP